MSDKKDFYLKVAKGDVKFHSAVNKFGRAVNCDAATATDIWDKTADQPIWVPPTTARPHALVLVVQRDPGAGIGENARDAPRDRSLVGDTHYKPTFALHDRARICNVSLRHLSFLTWVIGSLRSKPKSFAA